MTPIERAGYLAHARTPAYLRRLEKTRAFIADHADYAVSVSWGKDSAVMLHIAAQIRQDIVALNARYPNPAERFADLDRVRDEMLARTDMQSVRYAEVDTPGEWEMYERVGYGFASFETPEEKAAARWWKQEFERNMNTAMNRAGCIGHMIGLCAEESRARRMNVKTHGDSYTKKNGQAIALPMAWWTAKDIWSYIVTHSLPWLRIYDVALCGRERARSGFVFATAGQKDLESMGVWTDWRIAYPVEFRAWIDRWFPGR